jgi:APA family basic amino acid/polyamine antiporter
MRDEESHVGSRRPLRRILGLGFGLAIVFGNTVGLGILRLPGTLAAALGEPHLIVSFWVVGGIYALLGAVAVAELSTMYPEAGGFYVYARHAFGNGAGFVIGWLDWLINVTAVASVAMTATAFLGSLWASAVTEPRAVAITILAVFTALHWAGLKFGRVLTTVISAAVGLMLATLVVACFIVTPVAGTPTPHLAATAASLPLFSMAMLGAVVTAFRSVLVTFDGWYSPIYLAEESTNPTHTLPRALVGGTLLVAVLYLVINIALLRVLPLAALAASQLPAADAARVVLPHGGAELVTVISLLTMSSVINACLLVTPRILFAISRAGFFAERAARISVNGTPRVALALTSSAAAILIISGTFEQIIALSAVMFLVNYICAYLALFVLRRKERTTRRPYRAYGFPVTTAVVLVGSVLFLVAAVVEDRRSGLVAGMMIAACGVAYAWFIRRRRAP